MPDDGRLGTAGALGAAESVGMTVPPDRLVAMIAEHAEATSAG